MTSSLRFSAGFNGASFDTVIMILLLLLLMRIYKNQTINSTVTDPINKTFVYDFPRQVNEKKWFFFTGCLYSMG